MLFKKLKAKRFKEDLQKKVLSFLNANRDEIYNSSSWSDKDTWLFSGILLNDELKELLKDKINELYGVNKNDDIIWLSAEYWSDENKFKYLLSNDGDVISINDILECYDLNVFMTNMVVATD